MTTARPSELTTATYDAVVVGARCAGSTLAARLARGGWRVAVVDKARFPSDTLSTHVLFPDGVARLDELGALELLGRRHHLVPARYAWRVLGHEVAGAFTPVGGHDRALSVRRVSLDAVLVDLAEEAGAHVLPGRKVTGLVGSGVEDDPARGVRLDDGTELRARWVVGADGRHSSVARHLGLERRDERRGEVAMLLGYWRGLPATDWIRLDMHERSALMAAPCEDGLHLLTVAGPAALTRGTASEVAARYRAMLMEFPAVLNPRLLDAAELVSPVVGAPETMMRGYYRAAAGPGWALVGDAGHFKHPTTGQGIGDALAQAEHVAQDLLAGGDLTDYEQWRADRSGEAYEFSFRAARLPEPRTAARYAGLAADPVAGQQFLDTFTRTTRLADVFTPERSARWRAAAAYEDGLRRLVVLVDGLSDAQLGTRVPACPLWSVQDLVAHLCGVAEDSVRGAFFDGAMQAWADPETAVRREAWTAGQVEARRGLDRHRLVAELERHGQALVRGLRRGDRATVDVPGWIIAAPAADLAVHLGDLREALGLPPDAQSPIARYGFASYRSWLGDRVSARGLAPLRLADPHGTAEWVVGGPAAPGAAVEADAHELFRAISGRRCLDDVARWRWRGEAAPYLPLLSPYAPSS
ncbi:FAD-dependent monooxygenase [Nocardioides sediminis]|uniref:FAD-dependent monooxygenase n=1 Tax=Nocardioides sediminis TaxID=433648 RepID=UPI000D308281|nr:FAD-dependent monooxygenase [Nocardioides sediminis]